MIDVTCAVIVNDGLVLCAQRGASMSMSGKWEFPGGKVEPGESQKESLIREIQEELGYQIVVGVPLKECTWQYREGATIRLLPFYCTIVGGTLSLLEHSALEWVSVNNLLALDWAEADISTVVQLVEAHQ